MSPSRHLQQVLLTVQVCLVLESKQQQQMPLLETADYCMDRRHAGEATCCCQGQDDTHLACLALWWLWVQHMHATK